MSCSKYRTFRSEKRCLQLGRIVKSLMKENSLLKKILAELSHQNVQHKKLMKILENCLQLKNETMASSSGQQSEKEEKPVEIASKMKNQISCSDEEASTSTVAELQSRLGEAMEKNKQWLEYDQQREAYVKALLARMLGLEMQLNETNQRRHNEDYSDEKEQLKVMQEYYERLIHDAQEKLEDLKELIQMTQKTLTVTQQWCEERERGMEQLQQQLQSVQQERTDAAGDRSEGEEQEQSEQTKDLNVIRAAEKKHRSNTELQLNICQKFSLTCPHVDQKKTPGLDQQKEQPSRSCLPARYRPASCSHSVLEESFLKCPCCQAEYPATHYQDLVNHMDDCRQ